VGRERSEMVGGGGGEGGRARRGIELNNM